jgi:hypothetical protein
LSELINNFRNITDEIEEAFNAFLVDPTEEKAQETIKLMWKYGPAFGVAKDAGLLVINDNEIIEVDPNQNKYTCAPYGVPKCSVCLRPEEDCGC